MKSLVERTRDVSGFLSINVDRFLLPLTIIAALTLAGMIFSYATVH